MFSTLCLIKFQPTHFIVMFSEIIKVTCFDKGWLGAWWLGFVIAGGLTAVIAPLLSFFPRRLPTIEGEITDAKFIQKQRIEEEKSGREFINETKECALRLSRNKIYMWNLFSTVAAVLAFAGFGTFFPKYLEYHFRQKASKSSYSNLGGSIGTGLGIFIGGAVIFRFKFRAKVLAGWSVFTGVVGVLAVVSFSFMACPKLEVHNAGTNVTNTCADTCHCSQTEFNPTCSMDGKTLFFSPCHAGCGSRSKINFADEEYIVYHNCSCVLQTTDDNTNASPWWLDYYQDYDYDLPSPLHLEQLSSIDVTTTAFEGFCPSEDCEGMFYLTMVFVGIVSLLSSTSRVGNSIINLRAVEPRDKSASITILISALSLFALFPSPLIYGALMGKLGHV